MADKELYKTIANIVFRYLDPKKDEVFIFGSRATGTHKKFSDIDIGIKSSNPDLSYKLSCLEEGFEESNIPYRVDVVNFSKTSKNFKEVAKKEIISLNNFIHS